MLSKWLMISLKNLWQMSLLALYKKSHGLKYSTLGIGS